MQAVILAAGRGKRMNHLTNETPKPMIKVAGKNLIEWKIERLPKEIDEVIIVIGYLGEQIKKYFGSNFAGKKITYVEQGDLSGTGSALFSVKDLLNGKFIVMMGDDIYGEKDIKNSLSNGWSILTERVKTPKKGAKIVLNKENLIKDIVERSELIEGDLNNAGMYVLGTEIFNYPLIPIGNGEFGLPQTIVKALNDFPIKMVEVESENIAVDTPSDLKAVLEVLTNKKIRSPK
jgi:bifunctional UDP-N-acetylglucosamine pyrophosphorylase/glucosamine-1-phosphate N-acetyltransferase